MKKGNKIFLGLVERVIRNNAVREIDNFPPFCSGIFHQPKRPNSMKRK